MDEYARTGAADLPLVEEYAHLQAVHRHVPFAVREVDVRRFAAEFKRRRDEAVRRGFRDVAPDFRRAGECELAEARMFEYVLTRLRALAGDDVEDSGRQYALDDARELQHRKRRYARRLEYRAAASGEYRRELPRRHEEREVPRHDLPDYADRLAEYQRKRIPVEHRGASLFGAHRAREVAEVVGRHRYIYVECFAYRFSVVERLDHCEVFFMRVDRVGDLHQNRRAFCRSDVLP